jgi:hypothetical protein
MIFTEIGRETRLADDSRVCLRLLGINIGGLAVALAMAVLRRAMIMQIATVVVPH